MIAEFHRLVSARFLGGFASQLLQTLLMGLICLVFVSSLEAENFPERNVAWGFYQILWSSEQFERELDQQVEQLGGTPRYVLFFRDLDPRRGFPLSIVKICDRRNLIPIISFEPAPWRASKTYKGLERIAEGHYDAFFARWAEDAARWGNPVIFRFAFEMNGNWFSWGEKPEAFKSAWRRVHRIFQEAKAVNVRWMFSPNILPSNSTALRHPETYYPGDDVVDIIGIDGYNFGDRYDQWHRWRSFESIFGPTLDLLSSFNKPLFISEIGCADDSRKAGWIEDFLLRVNQDPRIEAFIYYNYYPKARGYPNWRLDSDDSTLRVFRTWARKQSLGTDDECQSAGC